MKIEIGRPINCTGREKRELEVYDLLDKLAIGYARIDYEKNPSTDSEFALDMEESMYMSKSVFLCNKARTQFYFLVMPEEKELKAEELSNQLNNEDLDFLERESMQKYLGANPHAIGVLDLIYDKEKKIHLLIDREVFDSQYFSCPACVDTASIRLRIEDFINRLLPNIDHDMTVVELSWL